MRSRCRRSRWIGVDRNRASTCTGVRASCWRTMRASRSSSSTSSGSAAPGGRLLELRELQQVLRDAVEAVDLAQQHVEGLAGPVGQLVAPPGQHLGGVAGHGQRGAQLVAHVGGETGLALDAPLHDVGHRVERQDQAGQVGVDLGGQARVETPGDTAEAASDTRRNGVSTRRLDQMPSRPPPTVATASRARATSAASAACGRAVASGNTST